MSNPLFRPHGAYEIEVSGSTLVVHMRGHWNAEMRRQVAREMLQHASALNAAGPWGIINVLHDTVVYGEEVYAQTRQDYATRPSGSRLEAVAFVINSQVEGAPLLRHRFDRLLEGVITAGVFLDRPSACAWIDQQLQST